MVNPDKPSIDYATGNIEYVKDKDGKIIGATVQHNVSGAPENRTSDVFILCSSEL